MSRSGQYITQSKGYKAFIPKNLPPDPSLQIDMEMISLLSTANLSLGKLAALTTLVPDPDLFVYLYVRKEALLSSQIEGTQCSLEDILDPELEQHLEGHSKDIEEVSNYVLAMNKGLARLKELPVCTRLIKEMHETLMDGVRGANKTPGEFRISQNWIGRPGATLNTADFVPPPPDVVDQCMSDLEKFVHATDDIPPLIKAALIHAQFETIHPFLDGNGRLGRLLITYLLCYWNILEKPLLYLSYYFKANRTEYYSKLMNIRLKGDWEAWVKFFLRGISESAEMANSAATEIYKLHTRDRQAVIDMKVSPFAPTVFEEFCREPIMTVNSLKAKIPNSTAPKIQRALNGLVEKGILRELTGKKKNRLYAYAEYMNILTRDTTIEAR